MKLIRLTVYLSDDFDEDLVDDLCIDIEETLEDFTAVNKVVSQVVEAEET